jgi:effector-binding domain-containing protein
MTSFGKLADQLPEMFQLLAEHGIEPSGPPFFRYLVIDMERQLDVEAGIPVTGPVTVDPSLLSRVLPAGRYVSATYVGHPEGLRDVITTMLAWAEHEHLRFDVEPTRDGERWASRLEFYKTDPSVESDMNKWEIELAFKLAE